MKQTELSEIVKLLKAEIQQAYRPANEVILDDYDLRTLLKVSQRTTATWRQKRLIKHSFLQGKCYYLLSDILDAINQGAITPIHSQLKIKV